MVALVCWNCNQDIDVKYLDDIVNCPRCGETISREVPKREVKRMRRKKNKQNL